MLFHHSDAEKSQRCERECLGESLCDLCVAVVKTVFLLQPLQQMIAHAQRIRHNRQRRIHRRARTEKTAIHDIQIIYVMRFAIGVEGRSFGIIAETNRPVLMGDSGQWNLFTQK